MTGSKVYSYLCQSGLQLGNTTRSKDYTKMPHKIRCQLQPRPFKRREENQLDATECFIALIICSTCFGHLYAHHQELETILVLLPHMVCNALVAPAASLIPDAYPAALHLTADHQQPRQHTSYAAITRV